MKHHRPTASEIAAMPISEYAKVRGDLLDDGILNGSHTPNEGVEKIDWYPGLYTIKAGVAADTDRRARDLFAWRAKRQAEEELRRLTYQEENERIHVERARRQYGRQGDPSWMQRPPDISAVGALADRLIEEDLSHEEAEELFQTMVQAASRPCL